MLRRVTWFLKKAASRCRSNGIISMRSSMRIVEPSAAAFPVLAVSHTYQGMQHRAIPVGRFDSIPQVYEYCVHLELFDHFPTLVKLAGEVWGCLCNFYN